MGLNLAGKTARAGRRIAWRARRRLALRKRAKSPAIVNEVRRRLRENPQFFKTLRSLYPTCKVSVFGFRGRMYAVKNTYWDPHEGYDFKAFQRVFDKHEEAVARDPEFFPSDLYELMPTKVYGRVGPLVIMKLKVKADYLSSKDFLQLHKALQETNPAAAERLSRAVSQMENNIRMLGEDGRVHGRQVQLDVWGGREPVVDILGNTDPEHLEKGRWLLSLPLDTK